jgi:2-polyprenyl-6-hydroxyphenyl methylase/3-demethylubiquinone-9 3-methyltransferase
MDLAHEEHWDAFYQRRTELIRTWSPRSYLEFLLDHLLSSEVKRARPESILEVGCGDSVFLTHLGAKSGASRVCGLDYSKLGCELARTRLAASGQNGEIFCRDLFQTTASDIGQYDFVYSLGMVEHFSDLPAVVAKLCEFLKPGGVLVTEVPNLFSLYGLLCRIYQPRVMAKHRIIRYGHLTKAYRSSGLVDLRGGLIGAGTVGLLAWGVEPRWPRYDQQMRNLADKLYERIDAPLLRRRVTRGIPGIAPYVYAAGSKPL